VVVQLVVRDHLAIVVAPVERDVERERQEPRGSPAAIVHSSGAQRDEELVQLPERLAQPLPEADRLVGRLLRRRDRRFPARIVVAQEDPITTDTQEVARRRARVQRWRREGDLPVARALIPVENERVATPASAGAGSGREKRPEDPPVNLRKLASHLRRLSWTGRQRLACARTHASQR
jgi:hypothetical protein